MVAACDAQEESAQISGDLGAVWAGLVEQHEHLVVVLPSGSLAEACAANGVGCVDPGVDREAGRRDVAARFEVAGGGPGELCASAA